MLTTLTAADVAAAHYAKLLTELARVEKCTPQSFIHEDAQDYANSASVIAEDMVRYQHGMHLLRDYVVLVSDRSVCNPRFDTQEETRLVSPCIRVSSGHIATSEAYRLVGLAQR